MSPDRFPAPDEVRAGEADESAGLRFARRGTGRPLLLVHGLGGSRHSFDPITDALAAEREVIAPDLPGFGATPPLRGDVSIARLADALERFLVDQDLEGVDCAGSSMGARLVLELARRGKVGAAVALDPGGFWNDRERQVFGASVAASIALVRALQPVMPALTGSPVGRSVLFAGNVGVGQVLALEGLIEEHTDTPYFDLRTPERVVIGTEPGKESGAKTGG